MREEYERRNIYERTSKGGICDLARKEGIQEKTRKEGLREELPTYGGKNLWLGKTEFDWNGKNFREAKIVGHLVESKIRDGKEGTNMTDG